MGVIRYFKGYARVKITGASVEAFLNRLSEEKVEFWGILRQDELHYLISIRKKYLRTAETLALQCFCNFETVRHTSFAQRLQQLKKRPLLLIGMILALFASFYFQTYVLAIEVSGNEVLHEQEILRALEELDIQIGTQAAQIDQQLTKHRMLNLLPQLSWIAVNRNGCKLNVLVTERSFAISSRPDYAAANIVAVRDGVLTDVIVSEGMRLCKTGDTVKEGQILVSGFEDYGLILKGVCAEAEIYAQTWHTGAVLTPAQTYEKQYTGRQWTQYSLIVGRKRINLFGNSGISGTSCDKMVEVRELSIPNYTFPVTIERVTYREYELVAKPIDAVQAEERLLCEWERLVHSQMIAGQIMNTQTSCIQSKGFYALYASSTCHEMIARYAPMESVFEGETNE